MLERLARVVCTSTRFQSEQQPEDDRASLHGHGQSAFAASISLSSEAFASPKSMAHFGL